ncbi:MAG: hypothetical protein ACRDFX_14390, partial [Chloroflexota bacterium]
EQEQNKDMDEDTFDQHFTWFEWGFVTPAEARDQESARIPAESNGKGRVAPRLLERWDEDHRWPT